MTCRTAETREPGRLRHRRRGRRRVWFVEREANKIGRLDPATGKIEEFTTPGEDVPRRMGSDWDGNLWVGFHETGKLVKIDHKTCKMTVLRPSDPEQWHLSRGPRCKEQGDLGDLADGGQDRPLQSQDGNVDGVLAADRGVGCAPDRDRSVQPEPHLVVGRHVEPSRLHRGARPVRSKSAVADGRRRLAVRFAFTSRRFARDADDREQSRRRDEGMA